MQLSYDYAKDRALMCLRANYESHLWIDMIPNIRQRKDAVNRGKSHRRKAAGMFSDSEYRKRAPI